MAKRMLIDATHMEETRVVVLNGNRLEEFDFETSTKKQLKGNIYLAKVTRVEPSLQAAFVDYGGGRHGFLAFNEIHPDYYQIPVADRMALIKEEEALAAEDLEKGVGADDDDHDDDESAPVEFIEGGSDAVDGNSAPQASDNSAEMAAPADEIAEEGDALPAGDSNPDDSDKGPESLEEVGGEDEVEVEVQAAGRRRTQPRRQRYKIQEVIKRRQIILVQVVKEERGNKGAALTTYLSLAGRYCVLMPNTTKGGGISRKITSPKDRNRLKGFINDLNIPDGVAVILRTAAIERSKAEIRRDFEYLIRIWQLVRDTTLQSIAPTLVYEEGNLIKRSIRDLYSKDMDDVLVEGEEGYKTAKDFMRMLMPSHAKRVQPYKDPAIPLFHRYQVDAQIDAMHSANVQLKSGGYIVINPTEALVAIDVNSGRATRERNIEETAYKTNLEAAEEIARQLKLRDLAGLIVIDFIDMAENRNQHTVERRLKEAMRTDRARIQIGRISPFGLLELSRQRLRPSLLEASTTPCPHCEGSGLIRSTESAALHVLRAVEEEGIRRRTGEIHVSVATNVALYILNEKRDMLTEIENRHGFRVLVSGDDSLVPPNYELDLVANKAPLARPAEAAGQQAAAPVEGESTPEKAEGAQTGGRRSRRRRPRRGEQPPSEATTVEQADLETAGAEAPANDVGEDDSNSTVQESPQGANGEETTEKQKRRRRGRRGGRRHARRKPAEKAEAADPSEITAADGNESDGETAAADTANADTASEIAVDSSLPQDAGTSGEESEKAVPQRRTRRARSRASSGGGRKRSNPTGNVPEETKPDSATEDSDEANKASKPRRRRSRARKPKTPAAEPASEQATGPAGGGNGMGAVSGDGGGKPGDSPSSTADDAPSTAPSVPDHSETAAPTKQTDGSKRRGWWNRLTQ